MDKVQKHNSFDTDPGYLKLSRSHFYVFNWRRKQNRFPKRCVVSCMF